MMKKLVPVIVLLVVLGAGYKFVLAKPAASHARSPSASSFDIRRMWNASRCAVRCPTPGRRPSSVIRRLTGAENTGR